VLILAGFAAASIRVEILRHREWSQRPAPKPRDPR
jgi:hypothetical protein